MTTAPPTLFHARRIAAALTSACLALATLVPCGPVEGGFDFSRATLSAHARGAIVEAPAKPQPAETHAHAAHHGSHAGHGAHATAHAAAPEPEEPDSVVRPRCNCGCADAATAGSGTSRIAPMLLAAALEAAPEARFPHAPATMPAEAADVFSALDPIPI